MGCGPSQPEDGQHEVPLAPHPAQHPSETYGSHPVPQHIGNHEPGPSVAAHGADDNFLDSGVRAEFLRAIHKGLHDVPYVVIGGSALAEHGSTRKTPDVDVLLGEGISKESALNLLVNAGQGRFIRLGNGKIYYRATNGNTYQLDLTQDIEVDLPFNSSRDTLAMKSGVRVANMVFLLNAKAHAWQTRVPYVESYTRQRRTDANDILFCLAKLKGRHDIDRNQLRRPLEQDQYEQLGKPAGYAHWPGQHA